MDDPGAPLILHRNPTTVMQTTLPLLVGGVRVLWDITLIVKIATEIA